MKCLDWTEPPEHNKIEFSNMSLKSKPVPTKYSSVHTSNWRNALIRTIFFPVPFLHRAIPLIGGKSFFEIAIALFVLIICLAISISDTLTAGNVANWLGAIVVTLGLRNNIIYQLFGLTFERALYWHKLFAVVTLAAAIIHGVGQADGEEEERRRLEEEDDDQTLSGYILIGLLGGMALVYLATYVNFNVFYYFHIVFFLALIVLAFMHGATVLGVLGIVWGVDILVRYVFTHRTTDAKLIPVGPKVVKLSFPREVLGRFSPGQYCFLMVRAINRYEYHPFSITSCPNNTEEVSFCIKDCGDWTHSLYDLATATTTDNTVTTSIGIEGPYGSVGLDLFTHPCHEVIMLVGGGIGITPLLSIWSQLLSLQHSAESSSSLAVRKVIIIWSVRDIAEAEGLYTTCLKDLLAQSPQELVATAVNNKQSKCIEEGEEVTGTPAETGIVFEYHFHITSCKDTTSVPSHLWKPNRPHLPSLFENTTRDCLAQGFTQVAVCVSGTMPLIHETRDLCDRHSKCCGGCGNKNDTIHFDCHEEIFGF